VEVGLLALAPRALLDLLDVEGVGYVHGSSILGAPQGVRPHLAALIGGLLLVHALGGCARRRRELLRVGHIELQVLVPHDDVVLVVECRRLGLHDIGVVELDLGPWRLVLDGVVVRALEGSLANHCHGMGFVKLDGLHGLGDDVIVLEEDLHPKTCPKSVGSSGFILIMR
jgi:hypothetical protein